MEVPEKVFSKILYTTDLSEGSKSAFKYATSLSRRYAAELTVFHAIDSSPDIAKELIGYMSEDFWKELKKRDLDEVRQTLLAQRQNDIATQNSIGEYCDNIQHENRNKSFVKYKIEVQIGNPDDLIIDFANQGQFDLIIMGHTGRRAISEAFMGSTVRRVLRRSDIPCFVIRTQN